MKKKHFLSKTERAAMKEDVRIALEYPIKSHARGSAVHEIAERFNVSTGVVYDMMHGTRRTPVGQSADPAPGRVPVPVPVVAPVFSLEVGGVTITAPSKNAVLEVVGRLLVAH